MGKGFKHPADKEMKEAKFELVGSGSQSLGSSSLDEKENQDVAVFSVSKDENKQIQIQLIGDEELYGKDYIIEPNTADANSQGATPNPGYSTNTTNSDGKTVVVEKTVIVQVQTWPVITYMYTPAYVRCIVFTCTSMYPNTTSAS